MWVSVGEHLLDVPECGGGEGGRGEGGSPCITPSSPTAVPRHHLQLTALITGMVVLYDLLRQEYHSHLPVTTVKMEMYHI